MSNSSPFYAKSMQAKNDFYGTKAHEILEGKIFLGSMSAANDFDYINKQNI